MYDILETIAWMFVIASTLAFYRWYFDAKEWLSKKKSELSLLDKDIKAQHNRFEEINNPKKED